MLASRRPFHLKVKWYPTTTMPCGFFLEGKRSIPMVTILVSLIKISPLIAVDINTRLIVATVLQKSYKLSWMYHVWHHSLPRSYGIALNYKNLSLSQCKLVVGVEGLFWPPPPNFSQFFVLFAEILEELSPLIGNIVGVIAPLGHPVPPQSQIENKKSFLKGLQSIFIKNWLLSFFFWQVYTFQIFDT